MTEGTEQLFTNDQIGGFLMGVWITTLIWAIWYCNTHDTKAAKRWARFLRFCVGQSR